MVWPVERFESSLESLTRWASPPESYTGQFLAPVLKG